MNWLVKLIFSVLAFGLLTWGFVTLSRYVYENKESIEYAMFYFIQALIIAGGLFSIYLINKK